MTKKTIELGENARVVIKNVGGDLVLKGWNRAELRLRDCIEEDKVQQEDNTIFLNCSGDGVVELPHDVPVEIGNVGGDASVRGLGNTLTLNAVGADLLLRDVGATTVDAVGGDFSARRLRDTLAVKSVGGDCVVREVNGQFSAQQIGADLIANGVQGDMIIQNVGGDCVAKDLSGQFSAKSVGGDVVLEDVIGGIEASAGGDATVAFSPVPWQAYAIQAGGDIYAQIPEDANAEFELKSKSKKIEIRLKENKQTIKEKTYSLVCGEGGPSISLAADGEITLSNNASEHRPDLGEGFDFAVGIGDMGEEFAQQTAQQIESQLGMLEEHLNTQLADLSETFEAAGLSDEKMQEVQNRIERAQERAAQKAQRAQEKLERKLIQTQRKAARQARKSKRKAKEFDVDAILAGKRQAVRVVSDKERMMILKMLQEKKITVEQAEELLSALEKEG